MESSAIIVEAIRIVGWSIGGLLTLLMVVIGFIGGRVITKQDSLGEKIATEMGSVRDDMNAMGVEIRREIQESAAAAHARITAVEGQVNFIKGKLDTNPGFMVKAP